MSLHEHSNGLLGTHVTWQDVELAMQTALNTKATFGENKSVTNISDLKGFLSRIALINPDWENVNETEKSSLPGKFVVKIPSQLALVEIGKLMAVEGESVFSEEKFVQLSEMNRTVHNREVDVYKLLAEQNDPNIPITKVYASKKFDESNTLKAYLISEYVENLHHIGMHESIPWQDLIPVVKSVAAFSAIGEKVGADRLKFLSQGPGFLEMIFGKFMDESMRQKTEGMFRSAFPEEYQEQVNQLIKFNSEFYLNIKNLESYNSMHQFFGYKKVLTHSDLWGSNLLCTKNGNHVALKAIIDWQTVSISSPAQDLSRLLIACLSKNDRREHAEELMEIYFNSFIEHLEGRPAPYTLENLKASYNLYAPFMTMLVLPGIEPILKHTDIPDKEKVQEAALDKMIGLLEDYLSTHEQNIKSYPGFFK